MLLLIRSDTFRQFGAFSWGRVVKAALLSRTFRPVLTLRLCQAAAARRGPALLILPALQVIHRCATHWAAMDLPWRTQIDAGLCITHGWGLVVSEGVRLGRNVTLFHGVTLGRGDRIAKDGSRLSGYPTVEDGVWIGPNAIVVGGITIGQGSRISGGALVTQDVPPYTMVGGNPAVVIKSSCTPDIMNPFVD